MSNKPVIVFIGIGSNFGQNEPQKDALLIFLKVYCGCKVISYTVFSKFKDDLEHLKKHAAERLILAIYSLGDYGSIRLFNSFYQLARSSFGGLPLVIIRDSRSRRRIRVNPNFSSVYSFKETDKRLIELVRKLVSQYKVFSDWLGAETLEDQALVAKQLEQVHQFHASESVEIGTPNHDHRIIAEALRIHLLPSDCLASEFDEALESKPRKPRLVKLSVYQQEMVRIQNLSDVERAELVADINLAKGFAGIYRTCSFYGEQINGFAIDTVTLETFITDKFSEHALAGDKLAERIVVVERLRVGKTSDTLPEEEAVKCYQRIITGLILFEIKGFETPIVEIVISLSKGRHNPAQLRKVAHFLKEQGKFIPIDHKGRVLEG